MTTERAIDTLAFAIRNDPLALIACCTVQLIHIRKMQADYDKWPSCYQALATEIERLQAELREAQQELAEWAVAVEIAQAKKGATQ